MKFQARGTMRSNPGFALANKVEPFNCAAQVRGQLGAEVGAISIGLGEVPVRLRIPFLKRHCVVAVASFGPVRLRVDPFTWSLKEISFECDALLGGKNGFTIHTDGKVNCRTEMGVEGIATGEIKVGNVHLGEEEISSHISHEESRAAEP